MAVYPPGRIASPRVSRPLLFLLLANVLGGLTYPLQKAALAGLPPATVSLLRTVLGLALMAGWLAARREPPWPFPRAEARLLALAGLVAVGLPTLLGAEGVARSTATIGSLLSLLECVSIVLFARLLLGERLGARRAAALALGLAGAALVVAEGGGAGRDLVRGEHLAGNVLLALSGFLPGIYTPLLKPVAARRDATAIAFATLVVSLALYVPAAAAEAPRWRAGPDLGTALLCTAALGVLATFLGTLLWTAAIRHLPANAFAPLLLVQPVVGAGAGALFLGERLSVQAAVGGVVVAAGVVISLGREEA